MTEYLSCAETAKLVRAQLKAKFPSVKFSVKSSVYSGGASIDVRWMDGPTGEMVGAVTKPFAGGGFDGMIDMAYSVQAYLLPDGSAAFAQTSGTSGSGGVYPADKAFMPVAGAKRVQFGANYVFNTREYSRGFLERALMSFKAKYGEEFAAELVVKDGGMGAYLDVGNAPWEVSQRWYASLGRRMIAKAA